MAWIIAGAVAYVLMAAFSELTASSEFKPDQRKPSSVADLLRYSPALRDQAWQRFRVKDGQKGPMIWEAKRVRFHLPSEDGDPGRAMHLVVARNVLKPDEVKYFVSNAGPETRLETLLLVAFSRWHIERCF